MQTDMAQHKALFDIFKQKDGLLFVIIHLADLSNYARNFDEAKMWAIRYFCEVKTQGLAPEPMTLLQDVTFFCNAFVIPVMDALEELGAKQTGERLKARVVNNLNLWKQNEKEQVVMADVAVNGGL
jgi:hypothetical protein